MKLFIKKIALFLFLVALVTSICIVGSSKLISDKSSFVLVEQPKTVIFGHSHAQCAYNDSIIPNFKNLSGYGEAYFYTFTKVKKVLEANSEIELVFIEFTNNQLYTRTEDWISSNEVMQNILPVLYPFIDRRQHLSLVKRNPFGYAYSSVLAFKKNAKRFGQDDLDMTDEIGNYFATDKCLMDSLLAIENAADDEEGFLTVNPPKENLDYLRKLIDLVKKDGRTVCLIRSPQHPKYIGLRNEATFQRVLKEQFNDIPFIDLNNFPLEKTDFADLEHLNIYGAEKVSNWMKDTITKILADPK